jgi:hypothetical protein
VLYGTQNETAARKAAVLETYLPELMIIVLTDNETELHASLTRPRTTITTA